MREALRHGYEVLLGRPLDSFPAQARYELWFTVDTELLPEEERVTSLTVEQLVVGRPAAPAATHDRESPAFWLRYAVDYAHTLFVFDKHDLDDAPPELVAALQASHYALTGEELARVVDDAGLELAEVLAACWYACRRAVTDGTLLDAMDAATLSTAAPHWLMSRAQFDAMADRIRFEPRWETALAVIEDAPLREHLLMSCVDLQTSRWAGSWFDPKHKPDVWLEPVTHRGGEILAIWYTGEGQATRAVVKFESTAVPIATELDADESHAIAEEPSAATTRPRAGKSRRSRQRFSRPTRPLRARAP